MQKISYATITGLLPKKALNVEIKVIDLPHALSLGWLLDIFGWRIKDEEYGTCSVSTDHYRSNILHEFEYANKKVSVATLNIEIVYACLQEVLKQFPLISSFKVTSISSYDENSDIQSLNATITFITSEGWQKLDIDSLSLAGTRTSSKSDGLINYLTGENWDNLHN